MPTSTAPPPPPKHGSGQFVGAVIVMLLLMGGLIYWKVAGSSDKPAAPPPPPVASGPAEPTVDQIVPAPPPPPAPVASEDAGVSTTAKKATTGGVVGTGCNTCGKCTGDAAPSFQAMLRTRASQAQRCYEKALAQQEGLQGRLSVSLCVGVGGGVCGASISADTLRSPLVSQCVLNIYKATTFPSPKNGCVDAVVPLNFLPEKK